MTVTGRRSAEVDRAGRRGRAWANSNLVAAEGRSREAGDRVEKSFAVAQQQSELFEVAVLEIGEHVHLDCVVAKGGLVLTEAETTKPHAEIHGRAPHGSAGYLCSRGGVSSIGERV
jgi:hypothetical protein